MNKQICEKYPHVNTGDCLVEIDKGIYYIFDPINFDPKYKGPVKIVTQKPSRFPYAIIINNKDTPINLLKIDDCLFFSQDGEKCDFAVFDDVRICFVELKKGLGNSSSKSKCKAKAFNQLSNTIKIFNDELDLNTYCKEAYPCVGYAEPIPSAPAADMVKRKVMARECNSDLRQGNKIEFHNK
jgi:hypothetical protein